MVKGERERERGGGRENGLQMLSRSGDEGVNEGQEEKRQLSSG